MRNNAKKKLSIIAMGCLAIACASVGGALIASAETVDPALLMENNGAFYMVEGAGVKLYKGTLEGIDGNAMRFIFEMSETQYGNMIENGEYKDGVSVSSYIIAEDNIDEGMTTAQQIAEDSDVITTEIPADKWLKGTSEVKGSATTVYHACAYVYNLPKDYYDDNVASFAIATISDSKLYTSVQSRSMSYVADKALDSGEYEAERTTLEGYLTDKFVWIKNASSENIVTDFEDTNSAYQKLMSEKTYTYFANSTIGATNTTEGDKAAKIVTETVGEVEGTYATLNVDSGAFRPIWLQPTMTTTEMQKYYDLGYTLKLKVYISANATVRGLHYDRTDSANPTKSSGMADEGAYADTNDEYSVTKNTWTEITIDFADYIYDCQVNNTDDGPISAQIKKDDEQLRGTIWVKGASYGPTIYMSEIYLEAPMEMLTATKGMTVDFASYIPEIEGEYEYYKVENGVYTELKSTSIVAGKNDFKIAIVKVADGVRMVANFVDVRIETADEWLADLNESISGTKVVSDYMKEGSAYQKLMSGKTYTYFANSTIGATNSTTNEKAAKIVTETVGEVEGTYATLNVDSSAFRPIWLQPTMTTTEMQKYYDLGYTLKLKVYISANATVRGLHYDRTDSANPTKSSGMAGAGAYADANDEYSVTKNTWTEITIDFADYIYDCQVNNTDNGPISAQIKKDDKQLRGTIWVKGASYGPTIYMSEMYLEAPKGETMVEVEENGSLTISDYKPVEDGAYEYYKFENGVYTEISGTTVTATASDFQIAIVKVSVENGEVSRTFVKRIDVTVGVTA